MKKCGKCGIDKPDDGYYTSKGKPHSYCKECQKQHKKQHCADNTEAYSKNVFENSKWLIDIKKELKCERCGFSHPAALDFHHKDPTQKEFGIGGRHNTKNKDKVLKEIEKCEILCANCHRIEHAHLINEYINYTDSIK